MKIAIFAFLMVIVLTLVESLNTGPRWAWEKGRFRGHPLASRGLIRLERDLNNKLVQRDLGNGQNRYNRDVNKKHHVHMSYDWYLQTLIAVSYDPINFEVPRFTHGVLGGSVAQASVVSPESSGFLHHWWHQLNLPQRYS
jgi:hypothetical protein